MALNTFEANVLYYLVDLIILILVRESFCNALAIGVNQGGNMKADLPEDAHCDRRNLSWRCMYKMPCKRTIEDEFC
ncbi:unnamed protein product [Brugia timori]|uniref:Secreted protein n=1 Tax=Brugia timori TaxID=42155 RepID=A0A0R3QF26_9BILA|nr:unnamed protein product [Brugia timori]